MKLYQVVVKDVICRKGRVLFASRGFRKKPCISDRHAEERDSRHGNV